jgi:hypothetical protein
LLGAGLEKDLADATTTSAVLQTALDAKTREHTTLQNAVGVIYDTLETPEGRQSGNSLRSRLAALYCGVREQVRDALHTGMK